MSQPFEFNRNVTKSYISLGGNATSFHGNPTETLNFAVSCLSDDSVNVLQISGYFSTPAFPKGAGPDFVNAAAEVETSLSAGELLARLNEIETLAGRKRDKRWGQRTLDLDLISFGSAILPDLKTYQKWVDLPLEQQIKIAPEELILPHPRIQDRAFVLVPLQDVAPNWVHPVTNLSINALIDALPAGEVDSVKRLTR